MDMWIVHVRQRESKDIESRRHKYFVSKYFVIRVGKFMHAMYASLSMSACQLSKTTLQNRLEGYLDGFEEFRVFHTWINS